MFCNINIQYKMLNFSKLPEKMHNNRCLTGTLTVVVLSNLKAFVCPFSRYTFKTFGRKRREFPWWSNVTGVIVVRQEFIIIEDSCPHRKMSISRDQYPETVIHQKITTPECAR